MNILALEVSTSSAKAFVYSTEKEKIVAQNSIPYKQTIRNIALQDPEVIYHSVIDCARTVLNKGNYEIDIIGLVSTWHSFLLLDKDREPVGKIKTWADTDAAAIAGRHREKEGINKWIYQKTGCPVHSIYPLWKWIYLVAENEVTAPDKLYISSKPEYIFEKLTGEVVISRATASGTGLMNIHKLTWDEEILAYAGIKKEQLAPLCNYNHTASLLKSEADKLGIKEGIPVIVTGPDGALNQIGSGALQEGIMTLSVGTSGALRMVTAKPVLPDKPSIWCYYTAQGKRLAGAATSGAGNCIQWLKNKMLSNNYDFTVLKKLAGQIEPEKAPVFLPFLYGERCPGWQDNRRGGFLGLQGEHSIGHLYYAVLEGILFNLYQSYKILVDTGKLPEEIIISGGITRSNFWLQMAADIFQRDIIISRVKDASTMGAIVIALEKMGVLEKLEDFEPEKKRVISPLEKNIELYQYRFKEYMEWYRQTVD